MGTSLVRELVHLVGEASVWCTHSSEDPEGRPDGHVEDLGGGAHFRANFLC